MKSLDIKYAFMSYLCFKLLVHVATFYNDTSPFIEIQKCTDTPTIQMKIFQKNDWYRHDTFPSYIGLNIG